MKAAQQAKADKYLAKIVRWRGQELPIRECLKRLKEEDGASIQLYRKFIKISDAEQREYDRVRFCGNDCHPDYKRAQELRPLVKDGGRYVELERLEAPDGSYWDAFNTKTCLDYFKSL